MSARTIKTDAYQRELERAQAELRFTNSCNVIFDNHGILDLNNAPQWHTVVGGSYTYVKKIIDKFNGNIIKGNGAKSIVRRKDGVVICLANGEELIFDKVVCATHANQTYHMIEDITQEEKNVLEPWEYSKNRTILHTDLSLIHI